MLGWRGPGGPQAHSGGLPSPPPSTFHLLPTQTRKATSGQISSKVVSPLGPFFLLWKNITNVLIAEVAANKHSILPSRNLLVLGDRDRYPSDILQQ